MRRRPDPAPVGRLFSWVGRGVPAAALAAALAIAPAAAATTWEVRDGNRAEGCNANRDTTVCILVRCDAPGRLGTYFVVVEGDPFDHRLRMTVDGKVFPVIVEPPAPHRFGYGWKVRQTPAGFVAALRQGRRLKLDGAEITGGFDTFDLTRARPALDAVVRACGAVPAR